MAFKNNINFEEFYSKRNQHSPENSLEHLVWQVTSYASSDLFVGKNRIKKLNKLMATVDKAIVNLAEVGKTIANETPQMEAEMNYATEELLRIGNINSLATIQFANDTSNKEMRHHMISTSRNLLNAVTQMLTVADKIDCYKLQQKLNKVETNFEALEIPTVSIAVDEIHNLDDLLAVSENQILCDVNRCITGLQSREIDVLSSSESTVKARSKTICNAVQDQMDYYEPSTYTQDVLLASKSLAKTALPNFSQKVEDVIAKLTYKYVINDLDENEFIEACKRVYEAVRKIRRAVLISKCEYETDSDSQNDWETHEIDETKANLRHPLLGSSITVESVDEYPDVSGIQNAREAMKNMPEPDKAMIAEQVEVFKTEKRFFDQEVSKWDDTSNDLIVLAKLMCKIMIAMADFTKGQGPLQTTMAVIGAAKKISEAGTKLDKLVRAVVDQCPESSTKSDLLAYLQRIALYCQQLNITSKVKADVQNVAGELRVTGLDSATTLIQAAKNLMNAVVLTVKSCYVVTTKYARWLTVTHKEKAETKFKPLVWKMKIPEKKPLVATEVPEEVRSIVRRASQRRSANPMKILEEFQSPENLYDV